MLIIDEDPERKLKDALEAMRSKPTMARCIYFRLSNQPTIDGMREQIIKATEECITDKAVTIYFCGDGDVYILANSIFTKEGKSLILNISSFASWDITEQWVGFYEASQEMNKLLFTIEAKLKINRDKQEIEKKRLAQQQLERKRQELLTCVLPSEHIHQRRTSRETAELMIIEDDSFSRKLVSNVLEKKFSLTSLHDASHALDTYTKVAPDLLFLDIDLPDVTGHELLEKIIALDPSAYVVMLSGNADSVNISQAMKLGAKGFIAKPFTREKLYQYIERCPTIKQS